MPWARIDDGFYDHPKLDKLGTSRLACVGLHALALSWSNRYLTDGHIPWERVKRLGGSRQLADLLVKAELWERTDEGYLIHDFLEYNEASAAVRDRRQNMRELGKRGGLASGQARRLNRDASPSASATVEPPSHTRPIPSIPPPPTSGGRRKEGTSPRQKGTNPRANGHAPRQVGESPRQEREAEKRGPTALSDVFAKMRERGDA